MVRDLAVPYECQGDPRSVHASEAGALAAVESEPDTGLWIDEWELEP